MKLSSDIKKLIAQIRDSYNPIQVIIFGSSAKCTRKKDSDIDLLIVKNTKKDPLMRSYEVRKGLNTDLPLDILVYTPEELKKRYRLGDMFVREILETGEKVYEKKQ